MRIQNKKVERILQKYKELALLGRVSSVLGWDLNVNLPPKASDGRSEQFAYLTSLTAEKWLDKEFRKTLEDLNLKQTALGAEEKAIVRNLMHAGKYYWKIPKEIIVEFSETSSKAFMAWQKAKVENKFNDFLPHLKRMIRLNQIIAENLGYKENKYDALLDLFEPGLTTEKCKEIFGILQPELTLILKKITGSKSYSEKPALLGKKSVYPVDSQKDLAYFVLRKMNYDMEAGRMDVSSHPFTDTLDRFDVRITTRYKTSDFRESLMGAMHEGGHALYEQGVNEKYQYTPLDGGVSLGIHESQSRFWENQVGRSSSFMKFMTPVFRKHFRRELSKAASNDFFRFFNAVRPSFIRTEEDEVTYNLHIILRFELEESMVNGKVNAQDLPEVWRQMMKKFLGVVPATDREGVLQDVHWSHGMMGYFPTYTLGNLYAAQFSYKMREEIEVETELAKGNLGTILSWLRINIHQYGSLYWPDELAKKVTGETLNPKYFLEYIKKKYSEIYKLKH